jgi:prolyl 4-hydroxylase
MTIAGLFCDSFISTTKLGGGWHRHNEFGILAAMIDSILLSRANVPGFDDEQTMAWLHVQPGIQRIPSAKVAIFQRRNFLAPALCAALVRAIDGRRRPSTISDSDGDATFRTSETCDFGPDDALAHGVDRQIADFLGIDPAYGEPLQGQRYAVGQEFKAHTDYFEPLGIDYEKYCRVAGQRTWTAMIYLNEPGAGGATRFKAVDKIFQPETGKLLLWNNRRPDGTPNPSTIHQGMKVRVGTKYILTKWFREQVWG